MSATAPWRLGFGDNLAILAAVSTPVVAPLVTTCTVILAGAAVSLEHCFTACTGPRGAPWQVERRDLEVEPLPCGWLRVAQSFEVLPGD